MTSSIPEFASAAELEALLKDAVSEEEAQAEQIESATDFSEERLKQLASDICDDACAKSAGPMIHKVIALTILSRMIDWHTQMGDRLYEEGESMQAIGWLRDAGKLQAAMSQIVEVHLGPDDFTQN